MVGVGRTVRRLLLQCMNLGSGEKVAIITDTLKEDLAWVFLKEALKITPAAVMVVSKPTPEHGAEPNKTVADSMKSCDVALLITAKSLSHTKARRKATESGVRIVSMPGITEKMFHRGGLTADYRKVEKITERVGRLLDNAREIRVTASLGTDLTLNVKGRRVYRDTGLYHKKGSWGNLPAGEVFLAPVEGSAVGGIVFDGSMLDGKLSRRPVCVDVEGGRVVGVGGRNPVALKLKNTLWKYRNARNIAEFGIGTNPEARIIGNVLEDEKVLGTVHVAFGGNRSFGGKTEAGVHLDGVVTKPDVWVYDGRREKRMMADGWLTC